MMVVVALIGILARIAAINYQKYAARTRQSEAKIKLASVFSAMSGFYAEHGSFTVCLAQAGYAVSPQKSFYTTGFGNTSIGTNCGSNGNASCQVYGWLADGSADVSKTCVASDQYTAANQLMDSSMSLPAITDFANDSVTGKSFTAEAIGCIARTSSSTYDRWTIDNRKTLGNVTSGLN